jgi:hypothetical protein
MSPLGPFGPLHDEFEPSSGEQQAGSGDSDPKICIYPGCERPAVPPHPLGGPQPAFCDLEEHNALTAHQERQRRAAAAANEETQHDGE